MERCSILLLQHSIIPFVTSNSNDAVQSHRHMTLSNSDLRVRVTPHSTSCFPCTLKPNDVVYRQGFSAFGHPVK